MSNQPAPSEIHHSLLIVFILLILLAACTPTGPATSEVVVVDMATSEPTTAITPTATEEVPEVKLEIIFTGLESLDGDALTRFYEQTSEFMDAATDSINQDPALKAALYGESGLKVAFDPARLIFHDGIWGYLAPEGGPLSNNLLIISNAIGSEDDIRFCSIEGAASILGLNLNERDYYLDFANVSGHNVCMVRQELGDEVVAINNAQGQWSLPKNSGLAMAEVSQASARESGQTALEVAQEETVKQTQEVSEADQAAIRAEVLSYGIDLDNLANSDNNYISNDPNVGLWQTELNHSFESTEVGLETMVVLDIEQLHSEAEYNRAVTTDDGWKFIVWAKVAYKTSNNLWATANLPLYAYNAGTETIWMKFPEATQPVTITEMPIQGLFNGLSPDKPEAFIDVMQGVFERQGDYYLDTGAVFRLYTEYPDPNSRIGDGELGETPRYSTEQLELFRQTGDASVFEYQATDGDYFIWPFYSFFSVSPSNNY